MRCAINSSRAPDENLAALQCQQRLPNDAVLRLTWGKGVATAGSARTSQPQTFSYTVRKAFTAV